MSECVRACVRECVRECVSLCVRRHVIILLHSCDTVTVSAAVAMRSRADCSSMEGHTSLSTALVIAFNNSGAIDTTLQSYAYYNSLFVVSPKVCIAPIHLYKIL